MEARVRPLSENGPAALVAHLHRSDQTVEIDTLVTHRTRHMQLLVVLEKIVGDSVSFTDGMEAFSFSPCLNDGHMSEVVDRAVLRQVPVRS